MYLFVILCENFFQYVKNIDRNKHEINKYFDFGKYSDWTMSTSKNLIT